MSSGSKRLREIEWACETVTVCQYDAGNFHLGLQPNGDKQ